MRFRSAKGGRLFNEHGNAYFTLSSRSSKSASNAARVAFNYIPSFYQYSVPAWLVAPLGNLNKEASPHFSPTLALRYPHAPCCVCVRRMHAVVLPFAASSESRTERHDMGRSTLLSSARLCSNSAVVRFEWLWKRSVTEMTTNNDKRSACSAHLPPPLSLVVAMFLTYHRVPVLCVSNLPVSFVVSLKDLSAQVDPLV